MRSHLVGPATHRHDAIIVILPSCWRPSPLVPRPFPAATGDLEVDKELLLQDLDLDLDCGAEDEPAAAPCAPRPSHRQTAGGVLQVLLVAPPCWRGARLLPALCTACGITHASLHPGCAGGHAKQWSTTGPFGLVRHRSCPALGAPPVDARSPNPSRDWPVAKNAHGSAPPPARLPSVPAVHIVRTIRS